MIETVAKSIFDVKYIKEDIYVSEMNNEYFLNWFIELKKNNKDKVINHNYSEIFIANRGIKNNYRVMSVGRYMGFRVCASKKKVCAYVLRGENLIDKYEFTYNSEKINPYQKIFDVCAMMQEKIKEYISEELYDVPFVGGCKNIKFDDTLTEIATFYIPEIVLYGYETNLKLFTVCKNYDLTYRDIHLESKVDKILDVKYFPEKESYIGKLKEAIASYNEYGIEKMVVAKKCVISTEKDINVLDLSKYLLENYYQQYFYIFETGEDKQWFGVSPEVLITDDSDYFISKPLAGTYGKGKNEKENQEIVDLLLQDPKEIMEHDITVNLMMDDINNNQMGSAELDDTHEIVETPYVYHIKSQIRVNKVKHRNVFDLLKGIYPPATIWGVPRKECSEQINNFEDFDRGYFTGLYGAFDMNKFAEFALIIRSAIIEKNKLSVFAGSGIVKLSDPVYEWNETSIKMKPFIDYFADGIKEK